MQIGQLAPQVSRPPQLLIVLEHEVRSSVVATFVPWPVPQLHDRVSPETEQPPQLST